MTKSKDNLEKKMTPKNKNTKPKNEVLTGEIVLREAPEQRIIDIEEVQQPAVNAAQLRMLTGQTPKWAIKTRQGRGNVYKYVPHGYVTDTLNKAFGFDWDLILDPISNGQLYSLEIEKDSKGIQIMRHVVVAGRLIVRAGKGAQAKEIIKSGFGSQQWLNGMELGDALKGARSDLIKTCAFQLGIALDLYWNERAELDEFVKVEVRKTESDRIAAELTSKDPETPIILLSRSQAEYDIDGMQIAEICDTTIDLIMAMNKKQIAACWKKVQNAAANNQ